MQVRSSAIEMSAKPRAIFIDDALIKKSARVAQFSVVTPDQSKFIRPVDTAILSIIWERDPHVTTYLIELLTITQPKQQNNTFRLPTTKKLGKIEDHIPIQT